MLHQTNNWKTDGVIALRRSKATVIQNGGRRVRDIGGNTVMKPKMHMKRLQTHRQDLEDKKKKRFHFFSITTPLWPSVSVWNKVELGCTLLCGPEHLAVFKWTRYISWTQKYGLKQQVWPRFLLKASKTHISQLHNKVVNLNLQLRCSPSGLPTGSSHLQPSHVTLRGT